MVPSLGFCVPEGVTGALDGPYTSAIDASSLRCLPPFLSESPSGKIDYPVKDSFRLCLTALSPSVSGVHLQLPSFPLCWAALISPAPI